MTLIYTEGGDVDLVSQILELAEGVEDFHMGNEKVREFGRALEGLLVGVNIEGFVDFAEGLLPNDILAFIYTYYSTESTPTLKLNK